MFHEDALAELTAIQGRHSRFRLSLDLALGDCLRKLFDIWAGKIQLTAFDEYPLPHKSHADPDARLFVVEAAPENIIVLAVVGSCSERKLVLAVEESMYSVNAVLWKDHRSRALSRAGGRIKSI